MPVDKYLLQRVHATILPLFFLVCYISFRSHTFRTTIWQRLINTVLDADLQPFIFDYLDDVVIAPKVLESYLATLLTVFDHFHAVGLLVVSDKVQIIL